MSSLVDTPVGPPIVLELAYCTACSDSPPSSHGYGWRSNASVRVFEDSVDGSISYRSESGNYLRWKLDGSDYVCLDSGTNIRVTKDSDPDATYTLTFLDQTRRVFDSDGKLRQDLDRNDNALTYGYSSGQLSSMTDASGNVVSFDYTGRSDGQPVEISCGGRSILYTYDTEDRLETVTDAAGETTTFVYNDDGLLWKILDTRDEEAMVYEYDDHQRVISETWYGLKRTERLFDGEVGMGLGPWIGTREVDLSSSPAPDRLTFSRFDVQGRVVEQREWLGMRTIT